jgi:hypothetical protein
MKMSNNPNGRPKGTGNVLAATIREQIRKGINTNDIVSSMFQKLAAIEDPHKYVQAVLSIFDTVLPRLPEEQPEAPQNEIISIFDRMMAMTTVKTTAANKNSGGISIK